MGIEAPYPLRQALRLAGVTRRFLDSLVAHGVISPQGGIHFTHQDVVVLRTAKALRDAGVPPNQMVRALQRMKTSASPEHLPGTDAHPAERQPDAEHWLRRGIALEAGDPAGAEAAYRRALALAPRSCDAYVNLGAVLCETGRCDDAVALYDQALVHCGDVPLLHYNRATTLEALDRPWQAVFAYKRAVALEPTLADAHYNLGVLLERLGDQPGSLRHLSAYRRHRL